MEPLTLDNQYFECLNCGSIGEHNFESYHDGEFGEALWTEYMESLTCDNCENSETIAGHIDDLLQIELLDYWSRFELVDKPADTKPESPAYIESNNLAQERFNKGIQGESDFKLWLERNQFSYLHVNALNTTFSTLFKKDVKKPDFILLLESIGMIAVDVKNSSPYKNSYTLSLGTDCFRSISFERIFRIPLWYAYNSEIDGQTIWLWISAIKALEVGVISKNSHTDENFIRIDLKYFNKIKSKDDVKSMFFE